MDYSKKVFSFLKLSGNIWESQYAHFSIGLKAFGKIRKEKVRVLDIGCGAGGLTALWQKKFRSLAFEGLDVSSKAINLAKRNYPGVKFKLSSIENYDGAKSKYDAISICEVIEHVRDPEAVLKKIKGLLNKNGILYLTTQLEKDKATLLGKIYGKKGIKTKESVAGHIQVFDRKLITKLIKDSGFKIIDVYYNCHFFGQIIDFIYLSYLRKKNMEVLSFTDYFQKKGGIIWILVLFLMRAVELVRNIETLVLRKKVGLGIQIIAVKK